MASGHRMQGGDAAELGTAAYQRQLLTELDLVGPQVSSSLKGLGISSTQLMGGRHLLPLKRASKQR